VDARVRTVLEERGFGVLIAAEVRNMLIEAVEAT